MFRQTVLCSIFFLSCAQAQLNLSNEEKMEKFRLATNVIQNSFMDQTAEFEDMNQVVHMIKEDLKNLCLNTNTPELHECHSDMRDLTNTAFENYKDLNHLSNLLGSSTTSGNLRKVARMQIEEVQPDTLEKAVIDKIMGLVVAADNLVEVEQDLINAAWAIERLEESLGSLGGNGDELVSTMAIDCTTIMVETAVGYFPQAHNQEKRYLRTFDDEGNRWIGRDKDKNKDKDKDKDKDKEKDKDDGGREIFGNLGNLGNEQQYSMDDAKDVMMEAGYGCVSSSAEPIISAVYPALSFADKFLINRG